MSYASPGGRRTRVVPRPRGLWMSIGYAPRAMTSSNFRADSTSSAVSWYSPMTRRVSRTPTFTPLWTAYARSNPGTCRRRKATISRICRRLSHSARVRSHTLVPRTPVTRVLLMLTSRS